jgi:hypothetical protein
MYYTYMYVYMYYIIMYNRVAHTLTPQKRKGGSRAAAAVHSLKVFLTPHHTLMHAHVHLSLPGPGLHQRR